MMLIEFGFAFGLGSFLTWIAARLYNRMNSLGIKKGYMISLIRVSYEDTIGSSGKFSSMAGRGQSRERPQEFEFVGICWWRSRTFLKLKAAGGEGEEVGYYNIDHVRFIKVVTQSHKEG